MSSIRIKGGEGRTLVVGLILVLSTLAAGCFPTWEPFPDFDVPTDRLLESGAVGRLRKQGAFRGPST
jgi:hypothetical protein